MFKTYICSSSLVITSRWFATSRLVAPVSVRLVCWHVDQDWHETGGKFLRKWPKTGIFIYFVTQSGTKNGLLMPIFSKHLKVLAMSTWSNTDVKPVKTFWENDRRPEFWLIFGPKMPLIVGLWGPYSTSPLKILAMSMWSNTDVKPVKTFWEGERSPEFWLTLWSKMAQKFGLWGPDCTHLWK